MDEIILTSSSEDILKKKLSEQIKVMNIDLAKTTA